MCKKLFFLTFALLSCNALFSQDPFSAPDQLDRDKSFRISAGIKVGGGMALATDPTVATTAYPIGYVLDFKNGLALQGGVVGNIHFGRRQDSSPGGTGWLGVQVEALYGLRTLSTDQQHLMMHCVEIPALIQVYPISSLAIEAGATFVRLLKCNPEIMQVGGHAFNLGQLAGANDVMLSFGASYKIPVGIMVDFRYNMSTSSLAGDFDSKVSSFIASIAYMFTFGTK